jgi:hypothetical protein
MLCPIFHRQLQRSILFESGFLKKVMAAIRTGEKDSGHLPTQPDGDEEGRSQEDELAKLLSGARCPLLGHLIQIAQVRGLMCRQTTG